jgi:hypothetical protein
MMPKATKIKGGKFTLPWNGPFKIQKMFDNNTMELSTISNEGVKRVNINKLKTYHHNNPPTNVIIMDVIVDTRHSGKKPNFPPNLHTKPNNLPWIDPKPIKTFNDNDIEWIEKEDSRSGIPRMSKNERLRKFSHKGRKKIIVLLYPRYYVSEKGNHKNKKVGLEPRLARVKETMHDMFNMPMNESHPIWPLEHLLCSQKLTKLKAIKHRYHVWKDYSKRNNEQIVEWNAITREAREKEIRTKVVAAKQGVPKDFWFKPYTRKFNGDKFVE